MRKYEILLLFNPNLKEEQIEKHLVEIEKTLDGKIVKKEQWGLKDLAYKIKKNDKAYYVLYYVEADPEKVITMKKDFLIKKDLLRMMILVHEKKWPFEMKTAKELVFKDKKKSSNYKGRNRNNDK